MFILDTSTADAMNWLESQGITMISTSDGNIITSAVESGQTITLTGMFSLYSRRHELVRKSGYHNDLNI